jgi:hypothetical protein
MEPGGDLWSVGLHISFGADRPRGRTSFSDRKLCGTDRLGRLTYLTGPPSHPKVDFLV